MSYMVKERLFKNNSMSENKNLPAFPFVAGDQTNPDDRALCEGLSKREYFAAMFLAGFCSNDAVTRNGILISEKVKSSLLHADELLKQLESA